MHHNLMHKISQSENIALYPSLSPYGDEGLACAWYEYSSPRRASESDIWFSKSVDLTEWSNPVCVSGNFSYNNGPSLIELADGGFLVAWHSWRPPGREPFTEKGGLANIWMSRSKDGLTWDAPFMAFPNISGSKYASLVQDMSGMMRIVFTETETDLLKVSSSKDGLVWSEPFVIAETIGKCGNPDIILDKDNIYHMVFMKNEKKLTSIKYFTSSNLNNWTEHTLTIPRSIQFSKLGRPKIGLSSSNQPQITMHTHAWGSYTSKFDLKIQEPTLRCTIDADHKTGREFWALNTLLIRSLQNFKEIFFNFGSNPNATDKIDVTGELSDNIEYKFDGQVEQMIRELGTKNTRSLVCSDRTVSFELFPIESGDYYIEITYSSWIASNPGFVLQINGEILSSKIPNSDTEKCLLLEFDENSESKVVIFAESEEFDQNRPSKIVHRPNGMAYVAWTSFSDSGIDIVLDKINNIRES